MSGGELELELEPDPGWYEVPEDPDALTDWSFALVRELAGADADEDDVRHTAEQLRVAAERAHELQVELAHVLLPEPLGPLLAVSHVELVFQPDDGPALTLDDVARLVGEGGEHHLRPPEVSRTSLPSGPAVRSHALTRDEAGGVLEEVAHVLAVPDLADELLLRTTVLWRALAVGDGLVEQADRLAAGLVVRVL